MNAKDLIRLGVPEGASINLGMDFIVKFIGQGSDPSRFEDEVAAIIANPATFLGDPPRDAFARSLYEPAFKTAREACASVLDSKISILVNSFCRNG